MKNIWLVFTIHKELGCSNAPSLLKFLNEYMPEVIFLELPHHAFNGFYGLCNPRSNLESMAVRQYREKHPTVKLEPVDIAVAEDFERDKEELFERLAAESAELCQLLDEKTRDERERGLSYLNSEECSQRWAKIYAVMATTLDILKDPALTKRFESWTSTHEHRDRAMISNIRQYCRNHAFERGVFLVGAAHRRAIIGQSKSPDGDDPDSIKWSWQE